MNKIDDVDDDDNGDDGDVNGDGIASASGDEGPAFIPLDSPFVTQLLLQICFPIFIIVMMRMKLMLMMKSMMMVVMVVLVVASVNQL